MLAGGAAASGLPFYAILCLPILFAAGMSLFDTIDGAFMNFAYGWAFSQPVRKLFYNVTVTGLSVAVALVIGSIELLGVLDVDRRHRPQPRRLPGGRPVRADLGARARGLALRPHRGALERRRPSGRDPRARAPAARLRLAPRTSSPRCARPATACRRRRRACSRRCSPPTGRCPPTTSPARDPSLERTSVYRNLERLEALGVVSHVHVGHGPGLYALARGGDQEYLVLRPLRARDHRRPGGARRRARRAARPTSATTRASATSRSTGCARVRGEREHEHRHGHLVTRIRTAETRALGARCRHRRLAVADPAVVGRQPLGHEHAQPGASSASRVAVSSVRFWNTPPRQDHHLRPAPRSARPPSAAARPCCGSGRRRRRLGARARRRARPRAPSARVEPRRGTGMLIRAALRRVRDRLELDRRLALVGHLGAQPAERGDRVEQPPHARRHAATTRPVRDELRDLLGALRVRRRQRHRPSPPRAATRHAIRHGWRPRGRRPGSRTGHRCAGALEVAQVADQQLAAPDACRRSRSRSRRRSRRPPARSRRARPGTPRGGRGGAGPRRSRRPRGRARSGSRGSRDARRGRRPRARPRTAARSARSPPRRPAATS